MVLGVDFVLVLVIGTTVAVLLVRLPVFFIEESDGWVEHLQRHEVVLLLALTLN